MPVVFRHRGYRFFFYSNEGEPREPLHIHVRKGVAVTKIWLEPVPSIAESYGITKNDLRELFTLAIQRRDEIERHWHEHFDN